MRKVSSTSGSSFDDSSIRAFEEYALEFDSWYLEHPYIFESEVRAIRALRLVGLGLEVGVGSGVFARWLGVSVGIDSSLSLLLIAKSRGVDVARAVGEYLPFRDEAFDYLLMVNALCFLGNFPAAIKDSSRTLKRHGSLILCEAPKDSRWGRLYEEKARSGHRFYRYARLHSTAGMRRILEDAGFTVVDVKGTLSFDPTEDERVEEPESNTAGKGFVCLRSVKA